MGLKIEDRRLPYARWRDLRSSIRQLDIVCRDIGDYLFISGSGSFDPPLYSGWMDALNASDRFVVQAFKLLIDGAFDFLFRSIQILESPPVTIAEGSTAQLTADDHHNLAALESLAAVISWIDRQWLRSADTARYSGLF
jgi:hypothetical protein